MISFRLGAFGRLSKNCYIMIYNILRLSQKGGWKNCTALNTISSLSHKASVFNKPTEAKLQLHVSEVSVNRNPGGFSGGSKTV